MSQEPIMHDPESPLDEQLITEFLEHKGYTLEQARALPPPEFKALMTEANTYAATHIAEIKERARLVGSIHGIAESQ